MRIFYYGVFNSYGGLENFAKTLITTVKKIKPNLCFTLLVTSKDFSYKCEFESLGTTICYLPNPHKHPLRFYSSLRKVLKTGNPKTDLIQLNICSYRNSMLFKACKKSGIKTITVGHFSMIDPKDGIYGKFDFLHKYNRRKYSNLGPLVTISSEVTDFMFEPSSRPILINNGVNPSKSSFSIEKRNYLRGQLNVADDEILLGQIGRFTVQKNQIFSVKVLKKLLDSGVKAKLVFLGREYTADARNEVEHLKLSKYVVFLGPIDEAASYYSAFDYFLLPSRHEGMPLTIPEACCNGVECLISNNVAKPSFNAPCLHYLDLDVDLWAQHIQDTIAKLTLSRKNYVAGTENDMDVCAKHYISLYESTLGI